jgi:hypothetical protein
MRNGIVRTLSLGISILSVACVCGGDNPPAVPTDAEVTKQLVGKWAIEEVSEQGNLKINGTAQYKKDGTFEGQATIGSGEMPAKIALSGTWKVIDGVIVSSITRSSLPVIIAKGFTSKHQVISIDEKSLKFKTETGKGIVRMRLKD